MDLWESDTEVDLTFRGDDKGLKVILRAFVDEPEAIFDDFEVVAFLVALIISIPVRGSLLY